MGEQKKRGRPRNPANYYLSNDELFEEVMNAKRNGFVSERLGQLFMMMHDHILQHNNFRNYPNELKEDMRSYSLLKILKTFRGGHPSKCHFKHKMREKCFGYYSHAIFNNYLIVIGRHYKYLNMWRGYY